MNVAVTGGRDYKNRGTVASFLRQHVSTGDRLFVGDATGADAITRRWAHVNGVAVSVYCADWTRWGRAAGPIRNARILDAAKPELLLAFPGGRGTQNMKTQARDRGVKTVEVP